MQFKFYIILKNSVNDDRQKTTKIMQNLKFLSFILILTFSHISNLSHNISNSLKKAFSRILPPISNENTFLKLFSYSKGGAHWRLGDVQPTKDGGYITCSNSDSFGKDGIGIIISKFDGMGSLTWAKCLEGTGTDECFSIQQISRWRLCADRVELLVMVLDHLI